jgi:hypothetical protein
MLRKTLLAAAAIATVTAAALVPTTASAHYKGFGWGWGGWGGWGYRGGIVLAAPLAYSYSYNCIGYVRTPSGYLKRVWVPCY